MSRLISNMMLVANAGSGKTYQLTSRMVTLMALGVEPRKIAALTFTKKAAGEFLDAVFLRLAHAVLDPEKLKTLRKDTDIENLRKGTEIPDLDEVRCRELLREFSLQAGVLTMGTIDSLFARIARAFPLESGLPGEFSMIGDSELKQARMDSLASIFRASVKSAGGSEFLDLVRKISRRQGESEVFRTLLQAVEGYHAKFLRRPELVWGDSPSIWKGGASAILSAAAVKPAAEALWDAILQEHPDLTEGSKGLWRTNLDLAMAHRPGAAWSVELNKFVSEKLCNQKPNKDCDYIPTGGAAAARVYLRGAVPATREALLHALLRPIYESILERSKALHQFMENFETTYHETTRSRGRMTFSDVTDLLASQVKSGEWMASAGYRLNAKLDHWLLDEFQDTSRIQWSVLEPFIDEVIQDDSEGRSLFYVGDTKQAIYSWRGGDPKLFFEIFEKYNRGCSTPGEKRIQESALDHSYRSAKPIVDLVNMVFGSLAGVAPKLEIPEKTLTAWEQGWKKHIMAEKNEDLRGYVRWESVESEAGNDEEGSPMVHRKIADILEDVRPWERGLSCAVLHTKNEHAAHVASLLQARGIPVSLEGKANPCTDNPLGAVLLAAFRFTASPDDRLSRMLLRSSPLAVLLGNDEEIFRSKALEKIAAEGYEATVRSWVEGITLGSFLESRYESFLSAAAEYDKGRRGDIAEFIAFLESHVVQEPESTGVVRVMTVHQSKGLTFDMTIVSGLEGKGAGNTDSLHLEGEPPSWGCLLPSKDHSAADPVMREATESLRAESEYGNLCTAYVAMTRSKFALYVLTPKLPTPTTTKSFARLLRLTLSDDQAFVSGHADWYDSHPLPTDTDTEVSRSGDAATAALPKCIAGTPHPVSPSSLTGKKVAKVAQPEGDSTISLEAADLGTEIHELLSRIEWETAKIDLTSCSKSAHELLKTFLKSAEAEEVFSKPGEDWILWNEKPFDLMAGGKWISGIFDRVHIRREGGKAVEARIYDYKTNRSTPEAIAQQYEGQMEQYRLAAAKLLGITIDKVSAQTVPIRQS